MIAKSSIFKKISPTCVLSLLIGLTACLQACVTSREGARACSGNDPSITFSEIEKFIDREEDLKQGISIERLLVEFSESSLRNYLAAPRTARNAHRVSEALAKYGVEAESGEAVLSYIKDPRAWPEADQIGSESQRFRKINLVCRLARFDSPKIVGFLFHASDLESIRAEMPLWVELVGDREGEHQLAIELACLRGRACVALMLTGNQDHKRVVVAQYNKTLETLRTQYDAKGITEDERDALVLSLMEMQGAIVVGDCVMEENVNDCMDYLESLEGTFYGLGRYYYARYGDNTLVPIETK